MSKSLKKYWKVTALISFPFFYFFNNDLEYFNFFLKIFNKVILFSIVMVSIIMIANIRNLKSYAISVILYFVSCIFVLYIFIKLILFVLMACVDINVLITYRHVSYDLILSICLVIFTLMIALHQSKFIDLNIKDNVYEYINSDQYRTAVHETGHLVFYGLLKDMPLINVKIIDTKNCFFIKEYLGYVEISDEYLNPKTKSSLEWEMLMLLAGKELESYILKDSGSGSKGDFKKWKKVAHEYLNLGFGEIYYDSPNDDNERALNHITLSNLKKEQERKLYSFFEYNHKEILHIIKVLNEEKSLNSEKIKNLLNGRIKEIP